MKRTLSSIIGGIVTYIGLQHPAYATENARFAQTTAKYQANGTTYSGNLRTTVDILYPTAPHGGKIDVHLDLTAKNSAGVDIPVTGFDIQLAAQRCTYNAATKTAVPDWSKEPRLLKDGRFEKAYSPARVLSTIEYEHGTTVQLIDNANSPLEKGCWIIYAQGDISGQKLQGKSYDLVMIGEGKTSAPSLVASVEGVVDAWLAKDPSATTGGILHPKWRFWSTVEETELRQYKAGRKWGRKFAIDETFGGTASGYDPCADCPTAAATVPDDCLYEERLFLLGVDVEERNRKFVITPNIANTTAYEINKGDTITRLAGRYPGRKVNGAITGTYEVPAAMTRTDGPLSEISLEDRTITHDGIPGVHLPKVGGLFAVQRVLYATAAQDLNGTGVLEPGEFTKVPVAHDVRYFQIVPRGYEAEAFAAGLLTGGALGFGAGYIVGGGPTTIIDITVPDVPTGSMTSAGGGNLIE